MCGLFGFIAHDKAQLDLETFLHLGCKNDIRGGDSVGVFIDKEVEYGVDKEKLFSVFFQNSKLLATKKIVQVAVGHTRKASVGTIGLETAQPVVIRNNTSKQIEFVLLHNGTLTNHAELQKHLSNVPAHYTDSQIMAYCLYYKGFKMFSEYEGAGMFITIDYRKNEQYPIVSFFKGGSKENSWSKTVEEERPLFILPTNKGIWFSSVLDPLYIKSFGTKYEVENLPVNKVFSFQQGKLISEKVIDRSEKTQKKFVSSTTYQNDRTSVNQEWYNYDDDSNIRGTVGSQVYTKNTNSIIKITDQFPVMSLSTSTNVDRVEFIRGKYLKHNQPITDTLILSDWGFKPLQTVNSLHHTYYFFLGVLVYGKNVYQALIDFQKMYNISDDEMLTTYAHIVYSFSHSLKYDLKTKLCENGKEFDLLYKNGKYFPLFSTAFPVEYNIEGGKILSSTEKNFVEVAEESTKYAKDCEEHDKVTTEEYLTFFIENIK